MRVRFYNVIAALFALTATTTFAGPVHMDLVTQNGLVVGSFDNKGPKPLFLQPFEPLHGTIILQVLLPKVIPAYGTVDYKLVLRTNTQLRLTYQDLLGHGCRMTFLLYNPKDGRPDGAAFEHSINSIGINNNTTCGDSGETDNFSLKTG